MLLMVTVPVEKMEPNGWSSEVLSTGSPEAAEDRAPGADIEATNEARNRR